MLPCRSDVPGIASQLLDGTSRHPGSVRQLETATHLAIHEHAIQIPFGNKTKPRKRAVPVLAEIALGNCGSRTTMELIKTSVARYQPLVRDDVPHILATSIVETLEREYRQERRQPLPLGVCALPDLAFLN
jgi:hypothetical protein